MPPALSQVMQSDIQDETWMGYLNELSKVYSNINAVTETYLSEEQLKPDMMTPEELCERAQDYQALGTVKGALIAVYLYDTIILKKTNVRFELQVTAAAQSELIHKDISMSHMSGDELSREGLKYISKAAYLDINKAVKIFKLAITRNGIYAFAHLAEIYIEQEKFAEATSLYLQALDHLKFKTYFSKEQANEYQAYIQNSQTNFFKALFAKVDQSIAQRNYQEAVFWSEQALKYSSEGNLVGEPRLMYEKALCKRAFLYERGIGEPENQPNYSQAAEHLYKTTSSVARLQLAQMYENAQTVGDRSHYLEALKAHDYNCVWSMNNLASERERSAFIERLKASFLNDQGLIKLIDSIQAMRVYSFTLPIGYPINKEPDCVYFKSEPKREIALDLSRKLMFQLVEFYTSDLREDRAQKLQQFKKNFETLLVSEDETMQHHRAQWKPILANILIALTGFGLIAIAMNASVHAYKAQQKKEPLFSFNHSLLFARPRSQCHIEEIENKAVPVLQALN